mgnify:CR=1 FL=1
MKRLALSCLFVLTCAGALRADDPRPQPAQEPSWGDLLASLPQQSDAELRASWRSWHGRAARELHAKIQRAAKVRAALSKTLGPRQEQLAKVLKAGKQAQAALDAVLERYAAQRAAGAESYVLEEGGAELTPKQAQQDVLKRFAKLRKTLGSKKVAALAEQVGKLQIAAGDLAIGIRVYEIERRKLAKVAEDAYAPAPPRLEALRRLGGLATSASLLARMPQPTEPTLLKWLAAFDDALPEPQAEQEGEEPPTRAERKERTGKRIAAVFEKLRAGVRRQRAELDLVPLQKKVVAVLKGEQAPEEPKKGE